MFQQGLSHYVQGGLVLLVVPMKGALPELSRLCIELLGIICWQHLIKTSIELVLMVRLEDLPSSRRGPHAFEDGRIDAVGSLT